MSNLKINSLPKGWTSARIDKVCDVNPRLNKSEISDDLMVSFVPMPAVGAGNGSIDVSNERPASEVKKGFTAFKQGDVLFAKITPCMENGKMAIVPKVANEHGFGSTEFHVLRPNEGVESRYVYYYVSSQTFRGVAERYMTGAVGQKRVSTTYLKEQEIPLAPPEEQKRIVEEIEKQFSRLDEAVANLKRVKANLKRYKSAVLKAAVEGKLTEEWRKQHPDVEPADKLLERILEERRASWQGRGKYKEPVAPDTAGLPELPGGWVWAGLDQVADVASGNTPSGILNTVKTAGDVPWFKVGDMNHEQNQIVMRHADAWLSFPEVKDLGLRSFKPGTVLFPKRGGAIATNKKRFLESAGCADLNVMGITPANDVASFIFAWFDGVDLGALSDGSNVPQINHKDIEPLVLPFPPVVEQHQIVAEVERRLSIVAGAEAQVDANLRRADRLRQSLLKKAFSGQLIKAL